MKTESVFPYELRAGDFIVSGPLKKDPAETKLVRVENFNQTPNAVSFYLDGQHKHFSTNGRARTGLKLSRVAVVKGSRWIGEGHYYSGSVTIERVQTSGASTWIRFYLDGHGEEEISIEEFLKHFKPDTSPVLVVDVEGGAQ